MKLGKGISQDAQKRLAETRLDYLLLSLLGALQPISESDLLAKLGEADARAGQASFHRLLKERLILRLRGGKCIPSNRGRKLFGYGALSKKRDIERMYHLLERDKEVRRAG